MSYIIQNKAITPDGTVLECAHRHDYQSHKDANGEVYMLDGLGYYVRTSVNKVPMTLITVTTDDDFEVVRDTFKWRSYGKMGNEGPFITKLKDLETDHIEAILETQENLKNTPIEKMFLQELDYRKTN